MMTAIGSVLGVMYAGGGDYLCTIMPTWRERRSWLDSGCSGLGGERDGRIGALPGAGRGRAAASGAGCGDGRRVRRAAGVLCVVRQGAGQVRDAARACAGRPDG